MMTAKDILKSKLVSAYNNGKLPHSFILFGNSDNSEKKDFVIELAFNILEPKRNCSIDEFKRIVYGENGYTDFVWIRPQDKSSILNSEIEKLNDILMYDPYESKNRIILISDADTMTDSAQNSLLKKLEEPPKNNFFFLTAPNKSSLLPTIVSRTLPLFIKRPFTDISLSMESFFNNNAVDSKINFENEKNITETISSWFLTSKPGFMTFNQMSDRFRENLSPDPAIRKVQLSYRLSLFALYIDKKYPTASIQILDFLENEQYFSADSVIFYNLFNIFKEMKG